MDAILKARIALLRQALDKNDDPSIGFLAPPSVHATFPAGVPASYQNFLREVDGAVCGVFSFYESDELLSIQGPAKGLPGGRQRWFCIGAVDEKPLVLDTRLQGVHVVDPDDKFDPDDSLGDLNYVLMTYVFGDSYAELVADPSDDGWYQFLQSLPFDA